jgi:thioester reductase-like protein
MTHFENQFNHTLTFFTAHATGTYVGDSVEGNAIAEAYGSPERSEVLRLASTRSNLGHMEAASFTLSLLKVLLMFQKKRFAPISSHFKSPNMNIPFEERRMKVQTECEPFPERERPIVCGINSFGFGGANGHCIIEEFKETRIWSKVPGNLTGKVFTFPLSAKSKDALIENVNRLHNNLDKLSEEVSLCDLAANLCTRMTHFRVRTSFSAASVEGLKEKLKEFLDNKDKEEAGKSGMMETVKDANTAGVVMVFPGQGSQWAGCGKELYKSEIVFQRVVDAIDAEWVKLSGSKLSEVVFDTQAADIINQCKWAQPATFLLQVGLYEMLRAQGLTPKAVIGHSAGEVGAAYASGAYSIEEACYIVYHRSILQEKLAGCGRMLVLMMERAKAEELVVEYGFSKGEVGNMIYTACINSPANTVLCGSSTAIEKFQEKLAENNLKGKLIPGNIAFHSPLMLAIENEIMTTLRTLDSTGSQRTSRIPFVSTVSGTVQTTFDAKYWWDNVQQPVNYLDGMKTIRTRYQPNFIMELSPHITLHVPTRECYSDSGEPMPPYLFSLLRNQDSSVCFADWMGRCFKAGLPINYKETYPLPKPITHLLPAYAMKEERVIDPWIDEHAFVPRGKFNAGPMLGARAESDRVRFQTVCSLAHFRWLADHNIQGSPIIPAAGYVEMILEAFNGEPIKFVHAHFLLPYVISQDCKYLDTAINPIDHTKNYYEFRITSRHHGPDSGPSTVHCVGVVEKLSPEMPLQAIPADIPRSLSAVNLEDFSDILYEEGTQFYETMTARLDGYAYGPLFQGIQSMAKDTKSEKLLAKVAIDSERWEQVEKMGFVFHPTLLDGALQMFIAFFLETPGITGVPQMLKNLTFAQSPTCGQITVIWAAPPAAKCLWEKGQFQALGLGERAVGSIAMYDSVTGDLVAFLGDYLSFNSNAHAGEMRKLNHALSWQPKDDLKIDVLKLSEVEAISKEKSLNETTRFLMNQISSKSHPDAGKPFFLNIGECILGEEPSELALEKNIDWLASRSIQYTILSPDADFLHSCYEKVGASSAEAQIRFASIGENFDDGMVREHMFELLLVRCVQSDMDEGLEEKLTKVTKLVAPNCLMLLELPASLGKCPNGFTALWSEAIKKTYKSESMDEGTEATSVVTKLMLFQAPAVKLVEEMIEFEVDTCFVVEDSQGFASQWRETNVVPAPSEGDGKELKNAEKLEEVVYFAMDAGEELTSEVAALATFCQTFSAQRSGKGKMPKCTFSVFTSGGMLSVTIPTQSGIWGAVRSLAMELSDPCNVDFRIIDLACKDDLKLVHGSTSMRERELCIHNGKIFTSRLISAKEFEYKVPLPANTTQAYKLHTNASGVMSELNFRTVELPELKEHEVEISVQGAALNFRDIMVALGRLPLQSYERSALGQNLGMECSGIVTKVGPNVSTVQVGERVIAMKAGCIANKVQCHELSAVPCPANLSCLEGSSVLSVYVTAYYSLVWLGRMREGQSVLVHSAMGGVGQAAIALAKFKGAKVYATAGTPKKRKKLKEMGCVGVFHSRSTVWYEGLMEATGGEGVDLCINSLTGEHIDLCLEALKAGGAHFEIGKIDIYADRPLKMSVFRKNITFRGVDIDRLMTDDPKLVRDLTMDVLKLLENKDVPVLKLTKFPMNKFQDALKIMMKGEHEGKIVLLPPTGDEVVDAVDFRPIFGQSANGEDRTTIISGGFSGFGLLLFRYTVAMGARNILMLDRDSSLHRDADWLLEHGKIYDIMQGDFSAIRIETVYADVSDYDHVIKAVAEVEERGMPPVGAVFHAAGVLDDKMLNDLDPTSFKTVYAPKVNGAWNLHRATNDCKEIEHFVMISSISSVMGNIGQINYSAANSYLDGLAAMRQKEGKPGLAFCLGAVSNTGMASRNSQLLRMMKANGTPAISGVFAINALDYAIRTNQYANHLTAITTGLFPANFKSPDYLRVPAQLVHNSSAFKLGHSGALSKVGIASLLATKVANLCGVEEVDPAEPFSSYGLNSLSVAELLAYIKNEMSFSGIGSIELMTSATCNSIAEKIVDSHEDTGDSAGDEVEDEESGESSKEAVTEDTILMMQKSRFVPAPEEFFEGQVVPVLHATLKGQPLYTISSSRNTAHSVEKKSLTDELVAGMPPACRQMLELLISHISCLDASTAVDAKPVQEIRTVMLTGATGFLGRHFIVDLLVHSPVQIDMIYCPIRADSDEAAMERLVKCMGDAGVWDKSYYSKICAFKSDLTEKFFGTSEEFFNKMGEKVDAVYHFASNISLSASFNALKDTNCGPMKHIFDFCIATQKKHLFLASTLGIFPQYFCTFTKEMTNKEITRDCFPDVKLMKQFFPIALAGYPWSKVINEIATHKYAEKTGIPLAIFRLPLMFMHSESGYTVTDDVIVRLLVSVLQTGCTPASDAGLPSSDAAFANKAMLHISMNPERKNAVYHCFNQMSKPLTKATPLNMLGFNCKVVNYTTFKEECQKLGDENPLKNYWVLMDLFYPYWYEGAETRAEVAPIDVSTLTEDCHGQLPAEVDALQMFEASIRWVQDHPVQWPFPSNHGLGYKVTMESIMAPAYELCKKYGIPLCEAIPDYTIEGIKRICDEMRLPFYRAPRMAMTMTSRLEGRIHLHNLLKAFPEIKNEVIDKPVFILGLNRTGSTFLHHMCVASDHFQAPFVEDQVYPPPAEEIDNPKFSKAERIKVADQFFREFVKPFAHNHAFSVGVPEEDMMAHTHAFASLEYDIAHDLPKYREWLNNSDQSNVYKEHKEWMQYIQWSRKRDGHPDANKRWCLKLPWHARSLGCLIRTYPDAKLIHTHRELESVAGSWCSLVEHLRVDGFNYKVDRAMLGKSQLEFMIGTLKASSTFRKEHPEFKEKFLDVWLSKLVAFPGMTAKSVLMHAQAPTDDVTMKKVDEFMKEANEKRKEMKVHEYNISDYDLTRQDLKNPYYSLLG